MTGVDVAARDEPARLAAVLDGQAGRLDQLTDQLAHLTAELARVRRDLREAVDQAAGVTG